MECPAKFCTSVNETTNWYKGALNGTRKAAYTGADCEGGGDLEMSAPKSRKVQNQHRIGHEAMVALVSGWGSEIRRSSKMESGH
jgi:hypothetical protein